jgi:hypothetical protein
MENRIALFRGINVGGRNTLPMAELRAALEALGLHDVRTHIQSGNVVFSCPEDTLDGLQQRIQAAVESRRGFAPEVLVLGVDELEKAAPSNARSASRPPGATGGPFPNCAPWLEAAESRRGPNGSRQRIHAPSTVVALACADQ